MQATIEQRNSLVRSWLRNRPLFNISAICRAIDYDRGSFARFESGHHDLKAETLDLLEDKLIPYGYIKI